MGGKEKSACRSVSQVAPNDGGGRSKTVSRPTGARRHRGDIMSPETRSRVMAKVRGKDTKPERDIAEGLKLRGLKWEANVRALPGCPDFVFSDNRVAVFVDGNFWHGYHFHEWRDKLSEAWEEKIAANILRDRKNRKLLRQNGWKVIRIWEHQVRKDKARCVRRILAILGIQKAT